MKDYYSTLKKLILKRIIDTEIHTAASESSLKNITFKMHILHKYKV